MSTSNATDGLVLSTDLVVVRDYIVAHIPEEHILRPDEDTKSCVSPYRLAIIQSPIPASVPVSTIDNVVASMIDLAQKNKKQLVLETLRVRRGVTLAGVEYMYVSINTEQ